MKEEYTECFKMHFQKNKNFVFYSSVRPIKMWDIYMYNNQLQKYTYNILFVLSSSTG